ncbi:hypothetical protein J2W14_004120 [Pseudarthrobacter oxydans]|uniref:hypothetical protein n=1 Tax=Pseudarthrobacter oxydans TaxID=1671 RepID=UPI00278298B8|nr:hypothetical protein [Pseudarthrobacter oxydans]MDP9984693.1 hypothetical protein [Pseudarthrobacter oxydans]
MAKYDEEMAALQTARPELPSDDPAGELIDSLVRIRTQLVDKGVSCEPNSVLRNIFALVARYDAEPDKASKYWSDEEVTPVRLEIKAYYTRSNSIFVATAVSQTRQLTGSIGTSNTSCRRSGARSSCSRR